MHENLFGMQFRRLLPPLDSLSPPSTVTLQPAVRRLISDS